MLNILLDSNVLISAYPHPGRAPEPIAGAARAFLRLANENGHTTYYHPLAMQYDFANMLDPSSREWRRTITSNHPVLPAPPQIQVEIAESCGNPQPGSNDWVDNNLLAAVVGHAVNSLVTEDGYILKKAQRLGLGERVARVEDAVAYLRAIAPQTTDSALLPIETVAHSLDAGDPIFISLRADYPGFDKWLEKCKTEHRKCWTVERNGHLAALTLVNWEDPPEYGPGGKTLKVCLLKVSEQFPGMRYGELLLKSAFDYAYANQADFAYVTAFPKYQNIVDFLAIYGFFDGGERTGLGERVMVKSLRPRNPASDKPDALDFHIRYGPHYYSTDVQRFIVPIEPKYHTVLFPEADQQQQLREIGMLSPAGNSIQKAYLSRSSTRQIKPGDILYFYRSHDRRRLSVVGIAEGTMVSNSHEAISGYVGKRSVYSSAQIREMTENGGKEALAILFRQSRLLMSGPSNTQLREANAWRTPSQSIMKVQSEGSNWLEFNIDRKKP